ncbi:MAG: autotransporter outer membrane beta-barrel domain-containing protein [Sutterellaceae bacterium]|nr:autotransporter outer membrane beta-barrel domain-containing protein [Sutterellaceae bacterium]
MKGLGGKAQAESQNIAINLGSKSSSAFVIGGGLAGAYQYDGDTKASTATSKANNVTITVGEEGAGDVFANTDAKGKYFSDVKTALSNIKNKVGSSISLTDVMKALQGKNLSALKDALGKLDTAGLEKDVQTLIDALAETSGVNVGIFGGGVAAAWSRNEVYPGKVVDENNTGEGKYDVDAVTAPKATATVENVAINVLSGYNVGVFGGGIALASGDATVPEDGEKPAGTLAQSDVQTVTLNFAGGETIGVMGGGIAYAGGTGDMNYGLGAVSKVGTVNINVIGGSVDGIIGGGYAVDDTNPLKNGAPDTSKTASSTVDEVNITATSGKIGRLAFDAFFGQNQMPPIDTSKPDLRNYLDSMTYAMIQGKTAIVGGGISSGNRDESNETGAAHVNKVFIAIGGTTVVGLKEKEGYKANIYGGGIATEGGLATVDSATILVTDKAQIYGDIYGGGLALQGEYNNADYYNNAEAKVGTSKIVIAGGTVHGDIYAGGKVVAATNHQGEVIAKSTVDEGYVTLADPAVFEGTKIDANGVTTAALTLAGGEYDFKTNQSVNAFSKVRAQAVKNFTFDFGDKTETNWTGLYDVIGITANASADTSTVELRSGAVATKTGYNNVTFNVTGGVLALGDKATAQTAFDSVSAMNGIPGLYLAGAVDLSNVAANIGDANTATTGSVVLGSGATLTADAGAKTSVKEGTISGLNIGNLYFTNVATEGASVMFGDALVGVDLTDLSAATLDNVRYVASYNGTSQTVTFVQNEDGIALASLGLDGFDGKALDQIEKQTDEASELIKNYLDGQNKKLRNGDHRHAQLNAAFNLAAAGGVQTAGIEGAMIGLDQVAKRASLTNTFNDGVTGFAEVTGTQVQMGGSRSMLETKTQLGGLAFGGEYTQGDWTIGALANVGTGEVKGHGDNGGVKNDVDYYGLQAYAARRIGDFNIVGQAGWMTTSNDIVHGSGDSADVDADVWTVGARGEMNLKFSDELSFVPYVGVNYLRVSTDGYTTKKGFKVEDTDQNLVNMPIGVAVSGTKSFDSGWIVKSVFDVGYVHMFGDTNVEADTLVGQARMGTDLDVWSENVGRARLGFEAQKDAMALGFGLGMAAGSDDYREVYGQVNVKYVF